MSGSPTTLIAWRERLLITASSCSCNSARNTRVMRTDVVNIDSYFLCLTRKRGGYLYAREWERKPTLPICWPVVMNQRAIDLTLHFWSVIRNDDLEASVSPRSRSSVTATKVWLLLPEVVGQALQVCLKATRCVRRCLGALSGRRVDSVLIHTPSSGLGSSCCTEV